MIHSFFRGPLTFARLLKVLSRHEGESMVRPWFLLWPGRASFVRLYVAQKEYVPTESLDFVLDQVSSGSMSVSTLWARDLVKVLGAYPDIPDSILIAHLKIDQNLVAITGASGDKVAPLAFPVAKNVVTELVWVLRQVYLAEAESTERHALSKLLSSLRDQQTVLVASANRGLIAANPSGLAKLKHLVLGDEANFLKGLVPLPDLLQKKLASDADHFQVVLGKTTAVGTKLVSRRKSTVLPIYGIEFLDEDGSPAMTTMNLRVLSKSELEIYDMICQGKSNRDIAQRRGRSLATIKSQIHAILQKLGKRNRVDLLVAHRLPPLILPTSGEKIQKIAKGLGQLLDDTHSRVRP